MLQQELGQRLEELRGRVAEEGRVVHHPKKTTVEGYPGEPPHTKELLKEKVRLPQDWIRRVGSAPFLSASIGDLKAFGIADSGRDLLFPAILQSKLVATTAEVQDVIAQRPSGKAGKVDLGELRAYSENLQELRARMLLLRENFSDHHGLNLADELTSLLRVLVFRANHPGASFDEYEANLSELTDENLTQGLEKLFENDANNFFSIFNELISYLSSLRTSQTKNREQELKEERAQYWVNGEVVLSEVVSRLNGVSAENLQKAFGAALTLSNNSFYARAEIASLTTSIEEEVAWTQLEIERAETQESRRQRLLELKEEPTLEILAAILRIGDNIGTGGAPPEPEQFGQWAIDYINNWSENYTRAKIGYPDITFRVGEDPINLINLCSRIEHEVPKDHFLKRYLEPFYTMIYPYYSARIGARKMKAVVMENYASLGDLLEAITPMMRPTEDSAFRDVYVNPHKVRDQWQIDGFTPFVERFRAASVIYDHLSVIYEIVEQEDDFFIKRYESKGYSREAKNFYGQVPREGDSRIPDFSRALLLMEQNYLGFLTINEALFIVKNIGALMPREMITADQELQTITAIRVFSALGAIRDDKFKSDQELMLNAVVTDSLKIDVKNQKIKYLWDGIEINEWNQSNHDYGARFIVKVGDEWRVVTLVEAERLGISHNNRHDLFTMLEKMRFNGGLAESIVSDVSWITMARSGGDVYTKGFMSEQVRLTKFYTHVVRYLMSKYPESKYPFAKIFPKILATTLQMIRVTGRPDSNSPVPMESLLNVYADENYDLANPDSIAIWTQYTTLSVNEDRADQIKRALAVYKLINDYSARLNFGLRKAYENNADLGKLREALQLLYKDMKYFEEMFPLQTVLDVLTIKKGEDLDEYGSFAGANLGDAKRLMEDGKESEARKVIIHYLEVEMTLAFFSEFSKKLYDENVDQRSTARDKAEQGDPIQALIETFVNSFFDPSLAVDPVVIRDKEKGDSASIHYQWMLDSFEEIMQNLSEVEKAEVEKFLRGLSKEDKEEMNEDPILKKKSILKEILKGKLLKAHERGREASYRQVISPKSTVKDISKRASTPFEQLVKV